MNSVIVNKSIATSPDNDHALNLAMKTLVCVGVGVGVVCGEEFF